jgi:hypothetical protein
MRMTRGQFDVVIFIIMFIALLIAAPICFKMVHLTLEPISAALNSSTPQVNETMTYIVNSYDNFWDYVVLMMFIALVISLFMSSFLVDIHPVFLLLYVLLAFIMVIITPMLASTASSVTSALGLSGSAHLQYTEYLRQHVTMITLGVLVISGIITFGKMRLRGGSEIP